LEKYIGGGGSFLKIGYRVCKFHPPTPLTTPKAKKGVWGRPVALSIFNFIQYEIALSRAKMLRVAYISVIGS